MAKTKASEQPEPESKPSTAPKIVDVTSDANTPADSSSRPIIISSRPIMRDPMMAPNVGGIATDEKTSGSAEAPNPDSNPSSAPVLQPPSVTKKKLAPLSEQNTEKTAEPADSSEPATKADDIEPTETSAIGVTVHDSIPVEPAKVDDEADTPKEPARQPDADKPEPIKPVPTTSSIPEPAAAEKENANSASSDQATQEAADAAALEEAITKEAEESALVEKLAEARTYVLPINSVQKRRSQQIALLGMFLIILLAFAWLDLATDVGLMHVPYLPITHFFGR